MKDRVTAGSLSHGSYILQIDGEVRSAHRRFIDALKAGMQLKQEFPHCDVKVRDLFFG